MQPELLPIEQQPVNENYQVYLQGRLIERPTTMEAARDAIAYWTLHPWANIVVKDSNKNVVFKRLPLREINEADIAAEDADEPTDLPAIDDPDVVAELGFAERQLEWMQTVREREVFTDGGDDGVVPTQDVAV